MAKKKNGGRSGPPDRGGDSGKSEGPAIPPVGSSTEPFMEKISRALEGREFESMESLQGYLDSHFSGESLDDFEDDEQETDPLRRAQDLVYRAWESRDSAARIRLAEEALELSPDCADAYNVLAEEKSRTVEEARDYYEKAVEAGERALGPEVFAEEAGHFWGLVKTRPYMRARAGLAECLCVMGEEAAAIEHYREMLRLNPNDNQGIRELLMDLLLKTDQQEEAGELLERYAEDASASWLYSRALWLYREEGESEDARRALVEALEQNPHVPAYLLGEKRVPRRLPEYVGWGDDREAQSYAADAVTLWKQTPGCRGWLVRVKKALRKSR